MATDSATRETVARDQYTCTNTYRLCLGRFVCRHRDPSVVCWPQGLDIGLISGHSPEPVELPVQTLAVNVERRKTVVRSRERFPMVPRTRFTRSLNITVPDGGEDTRPASRLRARASPTPPACFPYPHSSAKPSPTPRACAVDSAGFVTLQLYPLSHPILPLNPAHLSLINR